MEGLLCSNCGSKGVAQYGIFQKCQDCRDETIAPVSEWRAAVMALQAIRDYFETEGVECWLTSYKQGKPEALTHIPMPEVIKALRACLDNQFRPVLDVR
jgi:hypothetical protein